MHVDKKTEKTKHVINLGFSFRYMNKQKSSALISTQNF